MIQEKENELFERWKKERTEYVPFNEDGVVNPEQWEKTSPKIVFILRDTNEYKSDLRNFLKEGGRGHTWNNIVRWAEIILYNEYSNRIDDNEYSNRIDGNHRKKVLSSICAVNLKKQSGKGSSNLEDIKEAAKNDRCFIKEQLELYQPDIVIACGFGKVQTASLLKEVIYGDAYSEWLNVNELYYYRTERINKDKPIYVISMPHPSRAYPAAKWTNLLRELYNTLKNSGEVG